MTKHHVVWAVISNGAKARIIAHEDGHPKWTCVRRYPPSDAVRTTCDRAGGQKRGGRSGETSTRRAADVGRGPRRSRNRHLIEIVASALNRASDEQRFDDLALIAPAAILGQLRTKLSKQTRGKLMAEVVKDLTRVPVRQLERDLTHITGTTGVTPRPCPGD
jgi:protein required for attachment to host cells